ncbi:MAG TPA: TonB-dependent receptor, partial [Solibacterales bacterium]|nr:TonB-dependent receptor [Bryobacterales bacterium]
NRRDRRLQYNGMAVYSLNDSAWDARQYSVTGANLAKPDWSRMRGNVMFGGPLRIPRLISAEKMILFTVNYQYSRNRTGTISDAVNMPTALERAGDFSQTAVNNRPVTIYDPATGTPFAGNQIPESRLDARALGLASFLPMPNLPLAVRNYQTSWVGANDSHNFNARVMNIRLGSKDRLNGGIGFQRSSSQSPNLFQFVDEGAGSGVNASLMWSRTIRAGVINSANLAFSRARQEAIPFFAFERNVAGELGIPGVSALPQNWGPPTLRFVNYAGLSDGNYSLNRNQTFSVGDTLLWTKGTHTRSVGVNFRRFQTNRLSDTNGRGTWSFNGIATSTALNGAAIPGAGYDFADFLLGYATTSNIRYGNPDQYFRSSSWDIHANDDWRVHPKFTVNYGVRWDYALPVTELYGRLVNLASANGFATVNQVTPGGVLPDALVYPDRNNFSPRVGFAFRPRLNNSLVIRGGYGVYYNTSVYNIIAANMAQQPPFAQVLNASGSRLQPLSLANGFAIAPGAAGLGTYAIDPYYRIGYAQTWTVSVQRDLPRGLFATVGYLGTKGTRLDQQYIPNSSAPGLPQSTLPTGFAFQNSNGNSIYHAAQFQLNRRFRSGFGANTSYQWSKSIDNAGTGGRGQGGTPVAQNWLDYAAERGLSSFDARHNLSVQAQYSTAMGVRGGTLLQGWKGKLFKDWTVGSTLTFRSGNPFTATVRSQVQGTSVNNTVRADATGLPIDAPGMLFNTAAFAQPQAGRWGTAGRNTIPGPGALYLNGSVGRVIRFDEKRTLDLQMQGQNVLNRVVITQWGTVVGALNYGVASNAAAMRRLTLNARFRF